LKTAPERYFKKEQKALNSFLKDGEFINQQKTTKGIRKENAKQEQLPPLIFIISKCILISDFPKKTFRLTSP